MSYNDVYLGEKSMEEEVIKEAKKLIYNLCKSLCEICYSQGSKITAFP